MILTWYCQHWNRCNTCDKIMDTIPVEVLCPFLLQAVYALFPYPQQPGFSGGQIARTGTTL
jgi:hypothetical protein